ncbi:NAD+ synthase [Haladaptatus pallidirubidus]|uniref:NH(3)-dependent NAD(+) synthetase n=2 Tax=Haladaptatus pallidirubidus TaxID=1008152 RepID=A0AAV3UQT7_9EURY
MHEHAATLLQDTVSDADADGVIVAMSGGVDSSTTAALAADALGTEHVFGLLMPTVENQSVNTLDAKQLASDLGIDHEMISLQPILGVFEQKLASEIAPGGDKYAVGNLAARLRMACAYFAANATSQLVVGTSNRSERLLGYFTKYGDGGADVLPLGDYYKTEVRTLATDLGVPSAIIEKPPTAGFWAGQTDEYDLGASYETLDRILETLVDEKHDVSATARILDIDPDRVQKYAWQVIQTAHKRSRPPTPTRYVPDSDPQPTFTTTRDEIAALADRLTTYIREYVRTTGAKGVVVNMSGGLDSSVATVLAVEALGSENVYGLHLPCHKGTDVGTVDPCSLVIDLGIDYTHVNIHPLVSEIEKQLPHHLTQTAGTRELGNLVARVRMACAYYAANTMSRLVLGTSNQTERWLGYFTKYGDGGVDLQPLGKLYKTEVWALARYLGLPEAVIDQPATAGFRAGQTDEDDLGAPYGTLDEVLACLVDGNLGMDRTASLLDLDIETVKQYAEWNIKTQHKRDVPPTPKSQATADQSTFFHEIELNFY